MALKMENTTQYFIYLIYLQFVGLLHIYLVGVNEHHEGVSLARSVLLLLQEVVDELRRIGDQHIVIPKRDKEGNVRKRPGVKLGLGRSVLVLPHWDNIS